MELNLITDRTAEDVARLAELWQIPWQRMTEAQKALWRQNLKGAYNFSDLNRVENAVAIVGNVLWRLPYQLKSAAAEKGVAWDSSFGLPYDSESMKRETKTDWAEGELVSEEQMNRYLGNVVAIKNALGVYAPAFPRTMHGLTWQGANAIEAVIAGTEKDAARRLDKILEMIEQAAESWNFSGETYGGE